MLSKPIYILRLYLKYNKNFKIQYTAGHRNKKTWLNIKYLKNVNFKQINMYIILKVITNEQPQTVYNLYCITWSYWITNLSQYLGYHIKKLKITRTLYYYLIFNMHNLLLKILNSSLIINLRPRG